MIIVHLRHPSLAQIYSSTPTPGYWSNLGNIPLCGLSNEGEKKDGRLLCCSSVGGRSVLLLGVVLELVVVEQNLKGRRY